MFFHVVVVELFNAKLFKFGFKSGDVAVDGVLLERLVRVPLLEQQQLLHKFGPLRDQFVVFVTFRFVLLLKSVSGLPNRVL